MLGAQCPYIVWFLTTYLTFKTHPFTLTHLPVVVANNFAQLLWHMCQWLLQPILLDCSDTFASGCATNFAQFSSHLPVVAGASNSAQLLWHICQWLLQLFVAVTLVFYADRQVQCDSCMMSTGPNENAPTQPRYWIYSTTIRQQNIQHQSVWPRMMSPTQWQ